MDQFPKGNTCKKDLHQLMIQQEIDSHYPEPEKYQILESSINK